MCQSTRAWLLLALLPALPGSGCRSPEIKDRPLRGLPVFRAGAPALVPESAAAASSAEETYARLQTDVEGPGGTAPEHLLALADHADRIGRRVLRRDSTSALPWFRDAAAYAMFGLMSAGPTDLASPLQARAVALHNHAVEELLRCAGSGPREVNPAWREQLAAVGVEVAPTTPERATIPCDELWVAGDFRVKKLEQVGRDGLGVPLIAVSYFPDRQAVPDRFLPERLRLPATAVLRPTGPLRDGAWRSRPMMLALHDPAHESFVLVGSGSSGSGLAVDLTTPLAHQFIRSPLTKLSWGGMLRPEAFNSYLGILMYGPYQPGKVPVLFIHGLWSSPDAWLKMANSLQADPLILDRYQFWFAYYPTGAPLMVSAARLRQSLHDLREAIDPRRSDPALDQMVVVGHSLGGVLSKQLLQSSGQSIERGLLTRPLEQVAMSPEARQTLSRFLYFEPEPSIRRVVFIASPHRGSNTANQVIGRLGSSLVRRPGDISALHAEIISMNGPEVLQPAYRRRPPSSIDNLAWESPILKILSELPIALGVPYHSIVANLFPEGPPGLWTDGVVSYESAHLDGAESEVMIRHNHFANDTPEATAEVRRVLRLHLGAAMETKSFGHAPSFAMNRGAGRFACASR
ncbi:MAG: alpha/beta fold hydrolase [Planctomycetaceae bacterium]|nr:alpha/beta fold hydrolase [Planctomycetaceae bacterium]